MLFTFRSLEHMLGMYIAIAFHHSSKLPKCKLLKKKKTQCIKPKFNKLHTFSYMPCMCLSFFRVYKKIDNLRLSTEEYSISIFFFVGENNTNDFFPLNNITRYSYSNEYKKIGVNSCHSKIFFVYFYHLKCNHCHWIFCGCK